MSSRSFRRCCADFISHPNNYFLKSRSKRARQKLARGGVGGGDRDLVIGEIKGTAIIGGNVS